MMSSLVPARSTRLSALAILVVLGACEPASAPGPGADATADVKPPRSTKASKASKPGQTDMERFSGKGILDLSVLLNRSPEQVEAILGKPTDTGVQRVSCVRFVPERVFFACQQEARFYPYPQLERIVVEYEDGHATTISLVGLTGVGEFTPDGALAIAGLALPGSPRESKPTFGLGDTPDTHVQAWDWHNADARMRVEGQQYRVRVSTVNGEWSRSKVEVINNTPLDAEQRKRIKQSKSDPGVSVDPDVAPPA
jgi:hypothetical protein